MKSKLKIVLEYLIILIGAAMMGLSIVLFLSPNKIAAGGVSGLSVVINHLFNLPIGLIMLVFNIPLFLIGLKALGKRFGIRTLFGMIAFSLFTDFFNNILHLPAVTEDPLLASLYGGLLLGIGLGIVFKANGSTGGSDIVAQIFSQKRIMTAGNTFILIDFIVISIAGFCFKGVEYALWGFIALYVSSKVIDVIIAGLGYAKATLIISDKSEEIKDLIFEKMNRGVTFLKSEGAYSRKSRDVVLCIVSRREIAKLSEIVKLTDPDAFVIIQEVHQILGKGFKPRENIV
ncbi:MAG: YitT family protein [Candidatus Celaenobacter antarcticus]|nr:YitT family protein [Candidatus Celaenobacter antarcticus]MDP8315042.1 YitT family protein [Candidatus Celaenobacter antarcticus]